MPRRFAIGDIHGCSKTFRQLLHEEIRIEKSDLIYLIGDYIDRGPDSKGVIDIILDLWEKGYSIHTLRGNHEQMMMDSEKSESDLMLWLRNGGVEALQSFGKGSYADLDEVYRRFIEETKHYIELEDHVLAHAGLNLNAEDPLADRSSMLWSRQPHFAKFNGKTIIHGHTPIPLQQLLAQDLNGFSINLDGGCVYKKSGYGYLCALDLDRKTWLFRKSEG